MNFKDYAVSTAIFIFGIGLIGFTSHGNRLAESKTRIVPPPKLVEHIAFGYNETFADFLWLRVIQDIDHCEADTTGRDARRVDCPGTKLGWVFQMMDAITKLAPKFHILYQSGATILSVVVHDPEGAEIIYERGLENFPNDWPLLYNAGYHAMYNMHNIPRAASLLKRAGDNGAPQWVYSLAAKLYTQEGQAFLAKTVLEQEVERDPESRYAELLKDHIRQLDKVLADAKSKPVAAPTRSERENQTGPQPADP